MLSTEPGFDNLAQHDEARPVKKLNVILSTLAQRQPIHVKPKQPLHERSREEYFAIMLGGTLLAMNAGFMNAVAVMDDGYTASHITGTTSFAGECIRIPYSDTEHFHRYCTCAWEILTFGHAFDTAVLFHVRELSSRSADQLHFLPSWSRLRTCVYASSCYFATSNCC